MNNLENPLVSVLIANYNNGCYIEQAIKSIFEQTYEHWEIIIVDDASTDGSWSVIEQIAKTYSNIRIYQNDKNLKVGATKAKATSLAHGKLCAILDADDALEPTALEKHVAVFSKQPNCSLVGSNYFLCDEELRVETINDHIFNPKNNYSYLSSNGGIHHFWSFDKQKYSLTKGFEERFVLAEDQDLFYKLEEVGEVHVINEPLYYYRAHKNSISQADKVTLAYGYHILAQLEALKRRKKEIIEIDAVKKTILSFMNWGMIKIEKPFRKRLLIQVVKQYPNLIFRRKVLAMIYHLIKH